MQEKQHLLRYKGVRVSCHNEQLFWNHPVYLLRSSRNPRRYCRLYLGIKIYRQSTRIIFGARVARSLLWNTSIILHTSCASVSFAELVALSTVL